MRLIFRERFYNPTMYKAPERRELTEEERIAVANGAVDPRDAEEAAAAGQGIAGTGITVFAQVRAASDAAPPPPPETFGAYTKKSGKSNGVRCSSLFKTFQESLPCPDADQGLDSIA